jgi:hypothetical protein
MSDLAPPHAFAQRAVAFCAWAVAEPEDEATEAAHVRRLLASLYARALELPPVPYGELGTTQPSDDEWRQVFRRGGALPFNHYSQADPLKVPTDVVTIGDLADDLADLWRDLSFRQRPCEFVPMLSWCFWLSPCQ